MIQSRLNGNVIDIQGNSTNQGALLDAFPPKVGTRSLSGPTQFAANQTWEILPDPAGSSHFIIQNPGTGHCIDIQLNSTNKGAVLDAHTHKQSNNQNQLWDFLPDQYDSGYFLIQNPQTGYVIEIENGSSTQGASLVVNPRRLFGNNFQLWSGVDQNWAAPTIPALTLVNGNWQGNLQYVLAPKETTSDLTEVTVTIDIIEDLVADSFSIQINGNPPYPQPPNANWDARWMQYALVMQNNGLYLWTQIWHAVGPDPPGNPLASVPAFSPLLAQLANNTVPAKTKIVLTLSVDPNHGNFVTGVTGTVFDQSGTLIGGPLLWSPINQQTFNPGGPVKESNLAPLGAFQVVVVGPPGGSAQFTSGMGTITVTCKPEISAQTAWPDPNGGGTAENSNCYLGEVQNTFSGLLAQPFGVPSPKITSVEGYFNFAGTGLLPNSKLTVSAIFHNENTGETSSGTVNPPDPTSQSDGSFGLVVTFADTDAEYGAGTVTLTVTDSGGNRATGVVAMNFGHATLLT
jgi:hypothetical protein